MEEEFQCPRCHTTFKKKEYLITHLKKKKDCPPLFSYMTRDECIAIVRQKHGNATPTTAENENTTATTENTPENIQDTFAFPKSETMTVTDPITHDDDDPLEGPLDSLDAALQAALEAALAPPPEPLNDKPVTRREFTALFRQVQMLSIENAELRSDMYQMQRKLEAKIAGIACAPMNFPMFNPANVPMNAPKSTTTTTSTSSTNPPNMPNMPNTTNTPSITNNKKGRAASKTTTNNTTTNTTTTNDNTFNNTYNIVVFNTSKFDLMSPEGILKFCEKVSSQPQLDPNKPEYLTL